MRHFKHIISKSYAPQTVFWLALFVLSFPNICLSFTEQVPLISRLTNVILPVSAYVLALTAMRNTGRTVWVLFPLIFFSAFQIVLLYLYGHSVIAVDMFLNLLTTNAGEAMELLDNLLPSIVFVILVYVPLLVLASVSAWKGLELDRRFMHRARFASAFGLAVGAACLFFSVNRGFIVRNDLYPINVFYNVKLAIERTYATAHYAETSRNFTFKAHPTHERSEREVYVLVIGETARAADFQLYGYRRNTTPRLSAAKGLFVFSKALTQSNTTHKSVPMLISAVSAVDYDNIYKQKGLITAFKEAGFHTVFFSNQLPNHSFIDFFGEEADEWKFIKETPNGRSGQTAAEGKEFYDGDLLPLIDKVLAKKRRKQLIVLHTYGSHFEYLKRYPKAMSHYRPDDASEAEASNRPSLLNAYDNTIRYTDWFLGEVVRRVKGTRAMSALLYTSDHGENIFDDRRRLFLHASPIPSAFELHVPFMVWLSPRYMAVQPARSGILRSNEGKPVATNLSVFHTLIDLAGIRTPYFNSRNSVGDMAYRPRPYVYLNDHNEAIPLERMANSTEDVLYFRRAGIPFRGR